MSNPIDEKLAVDLSDVQAKADREKKVAEQQAYQRDLVTVARWDRAMRRAFKGIVSPAARRGFLLRAHD